jgi:hypothetical protein
LTETCIVESEDTDTESAEVPLQASAFGRPGWGAGRSGTRRPVACSSPGDPCTTRMRSARRFRFPHWKASIAVRVLRVLRHLHSGRLSPKASGLCKFVVSDLSVKVQTILWLASLTANVPSWSLARSR